MKKVIEDGARRFESLRTLLPVASKRLGPLPASEIKNLYGQTVNWTLTGPAEKTMPRDFAKCSLFYARTRLYVLRKAGWHQWPRHLSLCLADVLKAVLFGVVMRRRAIKELGVVKRLVGRERSLPASHSKEAGEARKQSVPAIHSKDFCEAGSTAGNS